MKGITQEKKNGNLERQKVRDVVPTYLTSPTDDADGREQTASRYSLPTSWPTLPASLYVEAMPSSISAMECNSSLRLRLTSLTSFALALTIFASSHIQRAFGFSTPSSPSTRTTPLHILHASSRKPTALQYSDFRPSDDLPTLTGALKDATVHEFILQNHKPLGCSVEESLAEEPDGAKYVFIAQVSGGLCLVEEFA